MRFHRYAVLFACADGGYAEIVLNARTPVIATRQAADYLRADLKQDRAAGFDRAAGCEGMPADLSRPVRILRDWRTVVASKYGEPLVFKTVRL